MDELLREASATLVDAEHIHNLSGSNLKCSIYYREILELINKYKYKRNSSLFKKFKSAMFEDSSDETAARRNLTDYTYLLKNCIKCKCAGCIFINDDCTCTSCVYGSYVSECDQKKRLHTTDPDVIYLEGYSDIKISVDIKSGKVKTTASDVYGMERTIPSFN